MNNVFFDPWEGKNYSGATPKCLVVGESHYAKQEVSPNFTRDLIREHSQGEFNHKYFTRILQVYTGKPHLEVDRKTSWDELSFFNYVQSLVGNSPGVGPTKAQFAAARGPFRQVLATLKPQCILVLSKRLWNEISSDGQQGEPLRIGNETRETLVYPFSGGEAIATWIPHPSYYFSAPMWSPWVKSLLERGLTN